MLRIIFLSMFDYVKTSTLLEKFNKTKDLISDMIYIEENKNRNNNQPGNGYRKSLLVGLK